MSEIRDYSGEIARLQCAIISLKDLDPAGNWLRMPLYKRWTDRRFLPSNQKLSARELNELTVQLEHAVSLAAQRYLKS
jgi:hypothetical protein